MAEGVVSSVIEVLLSKRVQDMALNNEEPADQFVYKDLEEAEDNGTTTCQIPVVELSLLSSSVPDEKKKELNKLRSVLSSWGCFQATGHGIPCLLLDTLRNKAREFFEQPKEAKKPYAKGLEEFEGYGADPAPEPGQPLDWSDRLFLSAYPERLRNPKLWPDSPKGFRETIEEYVSAMASISEVISKSMAKSLDLEENTFLEQAGDDSRLPISLRFNYYPCCTKPDSVLGIKVHADGSLFTIILQDDDEQVEGLQILRDEKWVTVPTIRHALLVLVGDHLEIMSNGIFKSAVHRVVVDAKRERLSVATFFAPEAHKEIGPVDGLINQDRPKLYKHVKNYTDIHMEYYLKGMRAIHIAQV